MLLKNLVLFSSGALFSNLLMAQSGPTDKPTDAQIVGIVETLNSGEVDLGKVASKDAKSKDVKQFASMMVKHHSDANKDAEKFSKKSKISPAEAVESDKLKSETSAKEAELKGLKGAALDKTYIDSQVQMHQDALDLLDNKLIPSASNSDLKALLQRTRSFVSEHLDEAKKIQSKLG